MAIKRSRSWLVLIMMAAMLGLQIMVPSEGTIVWPSLLFVLAVIGLYREEVTEYDWGRLKGAAFWESTGFAVTQGIIVQAVGIVIVTYGLKVSQPIVSLGLTPFIVISSILLSPIIEELVFRKIMFSSLEKMVGFWPSAVVSSVLFAVSHYNTSASLGYILLGIVWCRAYRKSGNLGVVVIAHMIFNALALLIGGLRG